MDPMQSLRVVPHPLGPAGKTQNRHRETAEGGVPHALAWDFVPGHTYRVRLFIL